MLYHLDRGLFIENGPSILAERVREARVTSLAYELLGAARSAPPQAAEEA